MTEKALPMPLTEQGFIPLLVAEARAQPERRFASFNGTPIRFGDLGDRSARVAAGLRRLGIGPGARVAVMMRNSPAAVATVFGIARSGAVWVPVNVQQRGDGLRYILGHADPELVVADREFVPALEDGADPELHDRLAVFGDPAAPRRLEDMLGGPADSEDRLPSPGDHFAIMYTSGTTGRPKGVIVTHRMMRLAGEGALLVAAARDGDVMFVWEPLYHIGGAQMLIAPLIRSVSLAMVDRFSASRFWEQARDAGATHIHHLGGILQLLLKQPLGEAERRHQVRVAWGGSCPKAVWRQFEERFGVRIHECYGMTEASSFTTYNDYGVIGSVGRPMPWLCVELQREDGTPAMPGERGEIVVRPTAGDEIFPGYFRNQEATAQALRGGALHTGDLGWLDEAGNLYFHGRMTDSVRVNGENISAWEVEHVIATHPAVEDCAIIGVAAEIGEQEIKLFVKPKPGAAIEEQSLSRWAGERLARYQNPRYIAIVDEFERTPSLRIMKHKLSREVAGCWDRLTVPLGAESANGHGNTDCGDTPARLGPPIETAFGNEKEHIMSEPITSNLSNGILTVVLNKPERLNAWDAPMRTRLREILRKANSDPAVRAFILTGTGDRAFCAGQDLNEGKTFDADRAEEWIEEFRQLYNAFRRFEKPVVMALNGLAAGSAFQVALLGDVRVGQPASKMGQPEINSGILSTTGLWLIREMLGLSRATELILTGRMMEAEECHRVGLIHHLVPADRVMAKAVEVATELASKPQLAYRLNKRRICAVTQAAFDETFEAARILHRQSFESGTPQREMEAFLARSAG